MAYETCPDCGSRQYNGRCSWCHEELAIYEDQMMVDGIDQPLSQEFVDKVREQEKDVERRREEARQRKDYRESL